MGTPDIAADCMRTLLDKGLDICAVFTQPDKPRGRGMKLTPPPVKELAVERGIEVIQPRKIRKCMDIIERIAPELIVVVAYGRLLPKSILDYPKYGCVNLHASLLPKLRGAAPIQRAIVNGDTVGGVTTMYMSEELDAGDMLLSERVDITPDDTAGTLTAKYATVGGELLCRTIADIEAGRAKPVPQNHSEATFAPPIDKAEAEIDWSESAESIRNKIRGFNPSPVAFTMLEGQPLKIYGAGLSVSTLNGAPGTVTAVTKTGVEVATGSGPVILTDVQAAGKKRMSAADWARGKRLEAGTVLGV